ncbi:hypothetical protein C8R43DRAFT_1130557 [Mycena crocata]|nr:hypothetical protein C8R43DRAFT_1130557 [Mycena crocata]
MQNPAFWVVGGWYLTMERNGSRKKTKKSGHAEEEKRIQSRDVRRRQVSRHEGEGGRVGKGLISAAALTSLTSNAHSTAVAALPVHAAADLPVVREPEVKDHARATTGEKMSKDELVPVRGGGSAPPRSSLDIVFPFHHPPPRASPATNERNTSTHTPVQPRPNPTLLPLPGDGTSATIAKDLVEVLTAVARTLPPAHQSS